MHNMVHALKRMGFKVEAPSPAVSSAGSSSKAPSPPEGKSPQPASPPNKKPKTNDVLLGPTGHPAKARPKGSVASFLGRPAPSCVESRPPPPPPQDSVPLPGVPTGPVPKLPEKIGQRMQAAKARPPSMAPPPSMGYPFPPTMLSPQFVLGGIPRPSNDPAMGAYPAVPMPAHPMPMPTMVSTPPRKEPVKSSGQPSYAAHA